jgi:hypothetical protein
METRIVNIRSVFKNELEQFISSIGSLNPISEVQEVLKEKSIEKVEKPKAIGQTPLMLKKINRYKEEQKKNNLKKQQKPFEYHGNIDEYEKELEGRFFTKEKDID